MCIRVPKIRPFSLLISYPGPFHFRPHTYHRTSKNFLLFRPETKTAWNYLFSWRHSARVFQMALHWYDSGDFWVPQSLWVRIVYGPVFPVSDSVPSDFFPVVITFLRQLPFIGTALSLPYVREVSSQAYCCPKAKLTPVSYRS